MTRSRTQRTSSARGRAPSGGRTSRSAKSTTDHEEIRRWVESHGGQPATVKRSAGDNAAGILRIDFPGFSGKESLKPVSWNQWFRVFDQRKLAFLYQAGRSRFNKLVRRTS